jgi:ATP-binding cassette subfamily B multidrug efflux pump
MEKSELNLLKNKKIIFAPPKNTQSLLSYIIKYHKQFIITAITGIAFNTAIVLGPIFQGKLLDTAVSLRNVHSLIIAGLQFIGITLSFQLARFFKRYFVRDMANRMSGDMRVSIMESIFNTDLNIMEKQKVGDMMSTTIGDVDIVVEAIRKTITEIFDTLVLMIAYWATLMIYDIRITLLSTIPIPIVILLAQAMRKVVVSKSKAARKANSKTTTQIRKMISEINILRLYGREEAELKRLSMKLSVQARSASIAAMLKNGLAPIYASLSTIGIILVIALGGNEVIKGSWTIGTFTAYVSIFIALATRTTTAANVFNVQQGAKASWERVRGLIENTNPIPLSNSISLKPKNITINNLSFKYPTSDKNVLHNFSLNVPAGSIIGITGSVGSGKSALGLALTGLYDYEGSIFLDNSELRELPYNQKLATITYMGHDPFLFSDSLENNITWGNIKSEKLDKVLNNASLKQDISILENGIKTEVGENGRRVSGGQKQRIALARALYKDANIVILDDPFSAVDIHTEANIIQELRKNAEDRTIFIFSHRLDVFEFTDMVLVLDKGEIVQQGTHEALTNMDGIYRKIRTSQQFLGGAQNE